MTTLVLIVIAFLILYAMLQAKLIERGTKYSVAKTFFAAISAGLAARLIIWLCQGCLA